MDQPSGGEWRNHSHIEGDRYSEEGKHAWVGEAPTPGDGGARGRFLDARARDPPFVRSDGRPVRCADAQRTEVQSAVAEGVDPSGLSSPGLQEGGASALYAAFKDTTLVQRWERWNSEIFQDHPRKAGDRAQGVASITAASDRSRA